MVNPVQETTERVMPAALPGSTLDEQIKAGEQLEDLMKHPGFGYLTHVIHVHREGLRDRIVYRKPSDDVAMYADGVGHLRGLGEFVPLARGIVQTGKTAAQSRRAEEA